MKETYSQTMSKFYGAPLGTHLRLVHDPQGHQYRTLDWQSGKLLCSILAMDHYDEHYHEQIIAQAEERGLEVPTWESTDSMLSVVLAFDKV